MDSFIVFSCSKTSHNVAFYRCRNLLFPGSHVAAGAEMPRKLHTDACSWCFKKKNCTPRPRVFFLFGCHATSSRPTDRDSPASSGGEAPPPGGAPPLEDGQQGLDGRHRKEESRAAERSSTAGRGATSGAAERSSIGGSGFTSTCISTGCGRDASSAGLHQIHRPAFISVPRGRRRPREALCTSRAATAMLCSHRWPCFFSSSRRRWWPCLWSRPGT